jgi:hypothetical protein
MHTSSSGFAGGAYRAPSSPGRGEDTEPCPPKEGLGEVGEGLWKAARRGTARSAIQFRAPITPHQARLRSASRSKSRYPLPVRTMRVTHSWPEAPGSLLRTSHQPPPRPLRERSDFPDLLLQIGLGNPGEGCPAGRWMKTFAKPAAPASPRRHALAGAARIVADGARRPAGHPSPGFSRPPRIKSGARQAKPTSPTRGEVEPYSVPFSWTAMSAVDM